MPIISSAGSLSYSRLSLGDANYTYWIFTSNSGTPTVLLTDNTNEKIISTVGSTGIISIGGFVAPEVNYFVTTTTTNYTAGGSSYSSALDKILRAGYKNRTYPVAPNRIAPSPTIATFDIGTGYVSNSITGWVYQGVPPSANGFVATMQQITYNPFQNNYVYSIYYDQSDGVDGFCTIAQPPNANVKVGTYTPNPYFTNIRNRVTDLKMDSSNNIIQIGTYSNSNTVSYYTRVECVKLQQNASPNPNIPSYSLITVNKTAFSSNNENMQGGTIAQDSNGNLLITFWNANSNIGYISKLDSNLGQIWLKETTGIVSAPTFEGSNICFFVQGGYIIKCDSNGNKIQENRLYSTTNGSNSNLISLSNLAIDNQNNYIIAGGFTNVGNTMFVRLPGNGAVPGNGTYVIAASTNSNYALNYVSSNSVTISNANISPYTPVTSTSTTFLANLVDIVGGNFSSTPSYPANVIKRPLS